MQDFQGFVDIRDRFQSQVSTVSSELLRHGRSESYHPSLPPQAIVYPQSTQDVADLVALAKQHKIPLVGRGAGTSLEGQTAAPFGGISVDFSQMNKIIDIDLANMCVTVQPGVTREELNRELRHTGTFFPVDPGANASLGGMAATRASGTTTVGYGTMRDNVMGLEAIMATGERITTGSKAKKSSAGYDLTALLVGSEGTLGLITELTLRLHPQPDAILAGIVGFSAFSNAVTAVMDTIQSGLSMARLEFLDASSVRAFNAYAGESMPEMPHLLFEIHGSENGVHETMQMFSQICQDLGGTEFRASSKTEDRNALWKLRHNGYYAILASRPGARAVVTDVCVPISELAEVVQKTQADIEQSPLSAPILGHVGDGNFHAILLIDPDSEQELEAAQHLSDQMVERALAVGGTCTGEHGIGFGKTKFMEQEHGPAWQIMGSLKRALDPHNILNPGKLVPEPVFNAPTGSVPPVLPDQ